MSTNDVIKSTKNCLLWQVLSWNHAKCEYYAQQLFSNFGAEIIIFPRATEAEMKNGVACKNQNMYVKISIYLNQASTLPFRPMLPLYRNQSSSLWSKSMGWFLHNGNSGLRNPSPLSPSAQTNQTYFSQKHKTKTANWKFSKQEPQTILCYFEY